MTLEQKQTEWTSDPSSGATIRFFFLCWWVLKDSEIQSRFRSLFLLLSLPHRQNMMWNRNTAQGRSAWMCSESWRRDETDVPTWEHSGADHSSAHTDVFNSVNTDIPNITGGEPLNSLHNWQHLNTVTDWGRAFPHFTLSDDLWFTGLLIRSSLHLTRINVSWFTWLTIYEVTTINKSNGLLGTTRLQICCCKQALNCETWILLTHVQPGNTEDLYNQHTWVMTKNVFNNLK